MGILDRIRDKFNNNVKADAIRELYKSITTPLPHDSQPVTMLHRFERLRAMIAKEADREEFKVVLQEGEPGDTRWGYSLNIGTNCLFDSDVLQDEPQTSRNNFEVNNNVYCLNQLFRQDVQAAVRELRGPAFTQKLESLGEEFRIAAAEIFAKAVPPIDGFDTEHPSERAIFNQLQSLRQKGHLVLAQLNWQPSRLAASTADRSLC